MVSLVLEYFKCIYSCELSAEQAKIRRQAFYFYDVMRGI